MPSVCPCCKSCRETDGIHKVIALNEVGVVLYRHATKKDDYVNIAARNEDAFILHKNTCAELKSNEIVRAFENRKFSCPRCQKIFQHAQVLLGKVPMVQNKVLGICDHCLIKENSIAPCHKCMQIVDKFTDHHYKQEKLSILRKWISKTGNITSVVPTHKLEEKKRRTYSTDVFKLCRSASLTSRQQRQPEVEEFYQPDRGKDISKKGDALGQKHVKRVSLVSPSSVSTEDNDVVDSEFRNKKGSKHYAMQFPLKEGSFSRADIFFDEKMKHKKNLSVESNLDDEELFDRFGKTSRYSSIEASRKHGRDQSREIVDSEFRNKKGSKHYAMQFPLKEGSFSRADIFFDEKMKHKKNLSVESNLDDEELFDGFGKTSRYSSIEASRKHGRDQSREIEHDFGLLQSGYSSFRVKSGNEASKRTDDKRKILFKRISSSANIVSKPEIKTNYLKDKLADDKQMRQLADVNLERTRLKGIQKGSRQYRSLENLPSQDKNEKEGFRFVFPKKEVKKILQPRSVVSSSELLKTVQDKIKEKLQQKADEKEKKQLAVEGKLLTESHETDYNNKVVNGAKVKKQPKYEEKVRDQTEETGKNQAAKEEQKEETRKEKLQTKQAEDENKLKKQKGDQRRRKLSKEEENLKKQREDQSRQYSEKEKIKDEQKLLSLAKEQKLQREKENKEVEKDKKISPKNLEKDKIKDEQKLLTLANEEKMQREKENKEVGKDKKSSPKSSEKEKKKDEQKLLPLAKEEKLQREKDNKELEKDQKIAAKSLEDKKKELQKKQMNKPSATKLSKTNIVPAHLITKLSEESARDKDRAKQQLVAQKAAEEAKLTKEQEAAEKRAYELALRDAKNKDESKKTKNDIPQIKLGPVLIEHQSTDALITKLIIMRKMEVNLAMKKPKTLSELNVTLEKNVKKHDKHNKKKGLNYKICVDSTLENDIQDVFEFDDESDIIIIGENIYNFKPSLMEGEDDVEVKPDFIKTRYKADESEKNEPRAATSKASAARSNVKTEAEPSKGVVRYALSDRTFIEKGWTMLPTEKIVRKMNVYRMRPVHPEFDWFERNKNKKFIQYDTGEKFAEFEENGATPCRWFYKNGRLALNYYNSEEVNASQRFVVYSSGEKDDRGRSQPITVLAMFDYLGNGVVFDHSGKIRLKYNQTEGVVLDRSIGPVSNWKWHTLNDPPVLQQVMIDTQIAHKDPDIYKMGSPDDGKPRPDNEDMLAIEFDNFIKEKSKKLSQKFKPFQIKMKALKINEHFSLKVLDQATVYLVYREGSTNIKLNIGMLLSHQEIVDTDTADVGEVSNSLERFPAKTASLAGLQRSVEYAQRFERDRLRRDRRLRPPQASISLDVLKAGISKPLRPVFSTVPAPSEPVSAAPVSAAPVSAGPDSSGDCKCLSKRFYPRCNVYYNTRV